jgi:hypothetical protein
MHIDCTVPHHHIPRSIVFLFKQRSPQSRSFLIVVINRTSFLQTLHGTHYVSHRWHQSAIRRLHLTKNQYKLGICNGVDPTKLLTEIGLPAASFLPSPSLSKDCTRVTHKMTIANLSNILF